MIIDSRSLAGGEQLAADVVVVGSGPAGLALALRLVTRHRLHVLVVEAGGSRFDFEDQSRFFAHAGLSDARHAPTALYRRRMLGGTSTVWGGRCIPMSEDDFARRPDLGRGGWPIEFQDVACHYPDALALLDAGRFEFKAEQAFPDDPKPLAPVTDGSTLVLDLIERFSPPSDLVHEHRREIDCSARLRIMINAPCVEILTSPDGREAVGVECAAGGSARRFEIRARAVVIAAGGLETPRLLLWSRSGRQVHARRGLGNSHDNVGRHYMTHVSGQIGTLHFKCPNHLLRLGYQRSHDGVWGRRLIQLSTPVRHEHALPNFVMRTSIPSIDDPSHGSPVLSAAFLVKRYIVAEYARRLSAPGLETCPAPRASARLLMSHAGNVAAGLPSLAAFTASWLKKRVLARRKLPSLLLENPEAAYPLSYDAEQLPSRANRVALALDRDPLGLPRLDVHWTLDPDFAARMQRTFDVLSTEFQRQRCASVVLSPPEREAIAEHCGAQGGHFMGTARMSASPSEGVVSPSCEVWDTANLYVAGSAVFPTSGFANPTLTIVALSLRLAEHIGQSLAHVSSKTAVASLMAHRRQQDTPEYARCGP